MAQKTQNNQCNLCNPLTKEKSVESVKSDVKYNKAALHPHRPRAATTF